MQALFESSDESPGIPGLGIVKGKVGSFRSGEEGGGKKVPHMGWNGAVSVKGNDDGKGSGSEKYGLVKGASYYFVHTFRVEFEGLEEGSKDWALTLTKYGDEIFVSSIQSGNVFATQFHPEKSGEAGLNVLKAWLERPESSLSSVNGTQASDSGVKRRGLDVAELEANGFTRRIVACLDVRANDDGDLVVTKGDQYDVRESQTSPSTSTPTADPDGQPSSSKRTVRNLGKPVALAERYFHQGADEIAFLNITSFRSCPLHDQPMLDVVSLAARTIFVPLTIGGGIRDTVDPDGTKRSALEVAGTYFRMGADKVSIGSDAVTAVEDLIASGEWDLKAKPFRSAPISNMTTTTAPKTKRTRTGIEEISEKYGAQAVVVSVDPKRIYAQTLEEIPEEHRDSAVDLSSPALPYSSSTSLPALAPDLGPNGERFCWYQCTIRGGRELRPIGVVTLVRGVQYLGAGEILLNSIDKDGARSGYDIRLVDLVRRNVTIPVVASSGAGKVEDFEEVFRRTDVEAALAAGIFHHNVVPLGRVKEYLREVGLPARKELSEILDGK